jgi:hypothetical protein
VNNNIDILDAIACFLQHNNVLVHVYVRDAKASILESNTKDEVFKLCNLLAPYLEVKRKQAGLVSEYLFLRSLEGVQGREHIARELEIVGEVTCLNGGKKKEHSRRYSNSSI